MMRSISPLAILSRIFGLAPSEIFRMSCVSTLCEERRSRVPLVVKTVNPIDTSERATSTACILSLSRIERNTCPEVGNARLTAIFAFASAIGKDRSMPITSPVDRISGPSTTSTPGNFSKGKAGSLTAKKPVSGISFTSSASSELPIITFAAILDQGHPFAFATNGTVRDARGLTSIT